MTRNLMIMKTYLIECRGVLDINWDVRRRFGVYNFVRPS